MKVCIVDDEILARQRMRLLFERSEIPLEIVGEAENGTEAITLIQQQKPDVVFLDIQMPVLSGFDVIDFLTPPLPHIIFVTAYDEYALKAFEVHALDYLTKPVRLERLKKTLEHIQSISSSSFQEKPSKKSHHNGIEELRKVREKEPIKNLTVTKGKGLSVVSINSVRRFEADGKIVSAFLFDDDKGYKTELTLDTLEQRLEPSDFCRTHRSHIIRTTCVKEIFPWFSGTYCVKMDDNTQIPIARRRVAHIKSLFGIT